MSKKKYLCVLCLDRFESAVYLMDKNGDILDSASQIVTEKNENGYIEYDPLEIIYSVRSCFNKLFQANKLTQSCVSAISIVSSSYAVLAWDKSSSMALSTAISTRCKRAFLCKNQVASKFYAQDMHDKTGLYARDSERLSLFHWLNHHNNDVKLASKRQVLALATVESWVLWHLTGLNHFEIDDTNASQTMLFNIYDGVWDDYICRDFGVEKFDLPVVRSADCVFGTTSGFTPIPDGIPICGMLNRIHSRLLSSMDTHFRAAHLFLNEEKCSLMVNIGQDVSIKHDQLKTMIVPTRSSIRFALDAVLDFPKIPKFFNPPTIESIKDKVFADLPKIGELLIYPSEKQRNSDGSPMLNVRHLSDDLTLDTFLSAYYRSLVFKVKQFISEFENLTEISLKEISISGRLSHNDYLRQFLSDILQLPVRRLYESHTYLRGVYYLAGQKTKLLEEGKKPLTTVYKQHVPSMDPISSYALYNQWIQGFEKK